MKFTICKKIFGKYSVQDSSGKNLFFCKRKFPLFWRYKFIDSNKKEIFSIKRKKFSFAYEIYELKKENNNYAKVIKEPAFNMLFPTIPLGVNKKSNDLTIAKIKKQKGTTIKMNAKNLIQENYQADFIQEGKTIAKSKKILGLKGVTKLYDVEIIKSQDTPLIFASLIIMDIMSKNTKKTQTACNQA